MSMLNLWFCGRIRSPLQLNSMQKTQSATTVSHFFVFRFPERLNQGYKLVNRVISSDDDQRLGDLICAGSGISHLTNCGTDFLTVRESMPIWDTGTSFPKVSLPCDLVFRLQGVLLQYSPNKNSLPFEKQHLFVCPLRPCSPSVCVQVASHTVQFFPPSLDLG